MTTTTFIVLSSIYTKEFNIILEILVHSILTTELQKYYSEFTFPAKKL